HRSAGAKSVGHVLWELVGKGQLDQKQHSLPKQNTEQTPCDTHRNHLSEICYRDLSTARAYAFQHRDGFFLLFDKHPSYVRNAYTPEHQDHESGQRGIIFSAGETLVHILLRFPV